MTGYLGQIKIFLSNELMTPRPNVRAVYPRPSATNLQDYYPTTVEARTSSNALAFPAFAEVSKPMEGWN